MATHWSSGVPNGQHCESFTAPKIMTTAVTSPRHWHISSQRSQLLEKHRSHLCDMSCSDTAMVTLLFDSMSVTSADLRTRLGTQLPVMQQPLSCCPLMRWCHPIGFVWKLHLGRCSLCKSSQTLTQWGDATARHDSMTQQHLALLCVCTLKERTEQRSVACVFILNLKVLMTLCWFRMELEIGMLTSTFFI